MRMNKETREEHPARRLAPHEAAGYEGAASALLPAALTRSHLLPSPRQPLRLTLTCCSFCSQTTVLDKALCKIEVLSGTVMPSREKQATLPGRQGRGTPQKDHAISGARGASSSRPRWCGGVCGLTRCQGHLDFRRATRQSPLGPYTAQPHSEPADVLHSCLSSEVGQPWEEKAHSARQNAHLDG